MFYILHPSPPNNSAFSFYTHSHTHVVFIDIISSLSGTIYNLPQRETNSPHQTVNRSCCIGVFLPNSNMDNIYCAGKRNSKGASSVSLLSIYWTLNSISGLQDFWMNVIKWIPICGAFHSRPAVESASIFHLSARLSATLEPFLNLNLSWGTQKVGWIYLLLLISFLYNFQTAAQQQLGAYFQFLFMEYYKEEQTAIKHILHLYSCKI